MPTSKDTRVTTAIHVEPAGRPTTSRITTRLLNAPTQGARGLALAVESTRAG